jgi:tRNA A-37 threonylcarbamoyl transferase component Bud32
MKKKIIYDLTESNISCKQSWYIFEACLSHRKDQKCSVDVYNINRPIEITFDGIY